VHLAHKVVCGQLDIAHQRGDIHAAFTLDEDVDVVSRAIDGQDMGIALFHDAVQVSIQIVFVQVVDGHLSIFGADDDVVVKTYNAHRWGSIFHKISLLLLNKQFFQENSIKNVG